MKSKFTFFFCLLISILAVELFACRNVLPVIAGGPSIVGTTDSLWGTVPPHHRMSWYANSRFWAFFANGGISYSSSIDGTTWDAQTAIISDSSITGHQFATWLQDGTNYIHIVTYSMYPRLYYGRGTLNSNGSITWDTDWQVIVGWATSSGAYPNIAVDSSGYPFVIQFPWR